MNLRSLKKDNKTWCMAMVSGVVAFVLGISSFGVAIKLSKYQNSPNVPPMLAGIPLVGAGILGMVGGKKQKHWMIALHLTCCLIVGVFSIHLMVIFLGKEAEAKRVYKAKCESRLQESLFCERYAAMVAMSVVSVLLLTLVPLGIISYILTRPTSSNNFDEDAEVHTSTLIARDSVEPSHRTNDDDRDETDRALSVQEHPGRGSNAARKYIWYEPRQYISPKLFKDSNRLIEGAYPTDYEIEDGKTNKRVKQTDNSSEATNELQPFEEERPRNSNMHHRILRETSSMGGKSDCFKQDRPFKKALRWTDYYIAYERGERIQTHFNTPKNPIAEQNENHHSDHRS